MNSIIQKDKSRCYLCGKNSRFEPIDKHHIFGGANRNKSEEYGLFVYLHHSSCHIFGPNAVHANAENMNALRANAQEIAMKKYGWSKEDFIRIFGKNWI